MNIGSDTAIILVAISNLALLASSRLRLCIRLVALQGITLGFFTLVSQAEVFSIHVFVLALLSAGLKGFVFPRLLFRTLEQTDVQHEMQPFVGYAASVIVGIGMLTAAFWMSTRLPVQEMNTSQLVAPIALWTIFVGLFLIVARRKAISQVLGYLVLENGIFLFGVALVGAMPLLVEMGGLLDVFMAVFVMGLAIFHINREFEHTDTDRLTALKD